MVVVGWYCIEVSGNKIAKQAFSDENIHEDKIDNIDNKIYWLNKQPIPAGQKLSFSDWTAINITPSNFEYRMLRSGIYWYRVVEAWTETQGEEKEE